MDNYQPPIEFTLFYDGLCPICIKEAAWLYRHNQRRRLALKDLNDTDFDPSLYGKTHAQMLAQIHGVYPDGRILQGMDAFRAAYRAVGLGWLLAPTGWPILKPLFDGFYWLFAKYRLRLARLILHDEPCNCGENTETPSQ